MAKLWLWIKNNKLTSLLIIVVIFLFIRNSTSYPSPINLSTTSSRNTDLSPKVSMNLPMTGGGIGSSMTNNLPHRKTAPSTSEERLVIETSNISLVVDDVKNTSMEVIRKTKELGGFMVQRSLTKPQESPFGTIVVRIPEDKTDEALSYFRSLAVKVSSEQILGQDVTDQYEDIDEKLATFTKTKAKFEEILEKAVDVDDILRVQRELVNLQSQIDSLKGRQKYLEKSAALTKITIYLSSDEMALPYQPGGTFRPKIIFKQAVRSLIKTLRGVAGLFIWLAVYAPVWGGILIIIYLVKRFRKRKGIKSTRQ